MATERDMSISNWLKIWIEKDYSEEQIEILMKEYFGEGWKASLSKDA